MKNALYIAKDSFDISLHRESLIFIGYYFLFVLLISMAVGIISTVIGFAAFTILATINNAILTLISILLAGFIATIIGLTIKALGSIFLFKGLEQLIHEGKFEIKEIRKTIRERIIQTWFSMLIISLLYLIPFALLTIPPFILFQEIGLIAGTTFFLLFWLITSPITILLTPIATLEKNNALETVKKTISHGIKNYIFNILSVFLLMIILAIVSLISILLSLTLLGLIVSIPLIFIMTAFTGFYIMGIYETNKQKYNPFERI